MNIFYLDKDPRLCAAYHIDAHVRKMCVEYAQILSTAHHNHPSYDSENMYKPFNPRHPSNLWVSISGYNYTWLYELFKAVCKEYECRFGKIHRSSYLIPVLHSLPTHIPMSEVVLSPRYQAMPAGYKHEDPVVAYRRYYYYEKQTDKNGKDIWIWTRRKSPTWVKSLELKLDGASTK